MRMLRTPLLVSYFVLYHSFSKSQLYKMPSPSLVNSSFLGLGSPTFKLDGKFDCARIRIG